MSLPKKIKIGYVDLDIIVVPKNSKFSKDNYGEYDSKTNSIRVAEGQRHEALSQRQLKLYRVSCVDYKNILHLCYSLPNPVPRSRWIDLADQLLGVH
jgi:hypothetical protein